MSTYHKNKCSEEQKEICIAEIMEEYGDTMTGACRRVSEETGLAYNVIRYYTWSWCTYRLASIVLLGQDPGRIENE